VGGVSDPKTGISSPKFDIMRGAGRKPVSSMAAHGMGAFFSRRFNAFARQAPQQGFTAG
jgi:hypothetical protein